MSEEKPFDDSTEAGISRRRMLKRVGAGAAIAWTAPVLTSIHTPAFAATPNCAGCVALDCSANDRVCGHNTDNSDCVCAKRNEDGGCVCYNYGGFCDPNSDICATDADCVARGYDSSYQCFQIAPGGCTQCGGTKTFCGHPCGDPGGSARGRAYPGPVPV